MVIASGLEDYISSPSKTDSILSMVCSLWIWIHMDLGPAISESYSALIFTRDHCIATVPDIRHSFSHWQVLLVLLKNIWQLQVHLSCSSPSANTIFFSSTDKTKFLLFSILSTLDYSDIHIPPGLPVTDCYLSHIPLSQGLKSIYFKAGKANGLDGIPPHVMMECAEELDLVLARLYRLCHKTNIFVSLKKGNDSTIPGERRPLWCSYYRRMASVSVVSKVLLSPFNSRLWVTLNLIAFSLITCSASVKRFIMTFIPESFVIFLSWDIWRVLCHDPWYCEWFWLSWYRFLIFKYTFFSFPVCS